MKIWNSCPRALGLGVSVVALLSSPLLSQRAHAFGGFWSSRSAPVKQTAQAVIFVDNPDATVTAIIQLEYAGTAQKFAWLVPVPGKPTVGVSSSTVFERLDAVTAPQYWVEVAVDGVAVEGMCTRQDYPTTAYDPDGGTGVPPTRPDATPPVALVEQGTIGGYEYVNIAVDRSAGDPAKAASDWLTANGYDLTNLDSKVLGPYLRDGLNLLAFKLVKSADVGAIRPVTLTYESKLPTLPLRPAAVAAQANTPIRVWVFGPSQAVPDNYKSLVLNEALIDWLSGRKYGAGTLPAGGAGSFEPFLNRPSNYDAVVAAAVDEAGGRGFVTELAGPAGQYRGKVWSTLDEETFQTISSQSYEDGIDAVVMAQSEYGRWDGWRDAIDGATTLPADVTVEQFSRNPDQYRGAATVDGAKFLELLQQHVLKPVIDSAALLYNAPYLTRLYSTMSADEMTLDPVFNYNLDLAQVSNVHVAKQLIQCSPALSRSDAPWQLETPQGGVVAGKGSAGWPLPVGSMPANLKVVMLSTSGSGTVVEDNSDAIAMRLFSDAGSSSAPTLRPPQIGLPIGGTQRLTPPGQTGPSDGSRSPRSGDSGCSASRQGAGGALALWLPFLGASLAQRRRRKRSSRS
jgi:hypothetical protein